MAPEHAEVLNRSQAHLGHYMTERPSRHWKTYDVAFVAEQPGDLDGPLPHKWPITERKMEMSTKANTPIKLKRLVLSSMLYLIWASLGAVVAIVLDRPAQFGGSTSGLPVVQDFIFGMGTAMSPPLLWWMVPQGLLTWLAWNQMNRRSTWGVIGLTLFGATTFIGAVGEPITYELLNPVTFNPLVAVIQAGMVIIPLVMTVFAIQEWRRRRSETKQKKTPAFLTR